MRTNRLLLPLLVVSTAAAFGAQGPERLRQEPGAGAPDAAPAAPEALALNEGQTQARVVQYRNAKHWAMKGLVLLSLGRSWHPRGAEIVLASLEDGDERLRAYGLEALARTDSANLRQVVGEELVQELIRKQYRVDDELWQARVQAVLSGVFPDAGATTKQEWERHWRNVGKKYTRAPWTAPDAPEHARTVSAGVFERALDLHEAGLDVCICIDSTGSMQATIDAATSAVDDIVALLEGVAPKFRLGLVHYKDFGDFGEGAQVLEPLSKRPEEVQRRLSNLTAIGGGDMPERVERGLEMALDKKMKWERSTNKLIVVIGDAPPHPSALQEAIDLAELAYRKPFGVEPTKIEATRSGRSRTQGVRPFITACLGVGPRGVAAQTEESFRKIAAAGGGAYARLMTQGGAGDPSGEIVAHILKLSFGAQYADSLDAFVEVYLTYHRRGLFK
jgi:hypothetical protein